MRSKIEPRDRPVVLALLAIPLALFLTLATFRILPPEPPKQQQPTTQTNNSSEEKISMWGWITTWDAEDYIALFTLMTLSAIAFQLAAMRRANDHFRITERAYINLSHNTPGVRWTPRLGGDHFDVVIRSKNHGATPGRTIGFFMTGKVVTSLKELKSKPIYGSRQLMGSFLVADDNTFISQPFILGQGDGEEVRKGQKILVVYGFIDYEDQFKTTHRAGYARVYDPRCDIRPPKLTDEQWADRNNLLFLETPHTYNFDLPLSKRAWIEA